MVSGLRLTRWLLIDKCAWLPVSLAMMSCIACSPVQPVPKAFTVDIATAHEGCGDTGNIVVTAIGAHRAILNAEPAIPVADVRSRLYEILRYRADRVVFIEAVADISWGEFGEVFDQIWPDADVVSIITPQVEKLAQRHQCLTVFCGKCIDLRLSRPSAN